jgi:hypothetical protein
MPAKKKRPTTGYGAGKYGKRKYGSRTKPKTVTRLGKQLRKG